PHRQGLQGLRRAGGDRHGLDAHGGDVRRALRSHPQRRRAAVLPAGVGPGRAPEHEVPGASRPGRPPPGPPPGRAGPRRGPSALRGGLVFFAWGEIYSLFPSPCGDTYGSRFAAANAGLLYTAKGTASLLVPLSSVLAESGGWHTVFYAAAAMNVLAAVLALV